MRVALLEDKSESTNLSTDTHRSPGGVSALPGGIARSLTQSSASGVAP